MPENIALADRVRLAIAGETDPNEVRKRVEEAVALHQRDSEIREMTAKSHEALVDNWKKGDDEPAPGKPDAKKKRRFPSCHKCHECYPASGACEHGRIVCWIHT